MMFILNNLQPSGFGFKSMNRCYGTFVWTLFMPAGLKSGLTIWTVPTELKTIRRPNFSIIFPPLKIHIHDLGKTGISIFNIVAVGLCVG